MSVIRSRKNRSVSHKLKRSIVFNSWRRHIGRNKKIFAKEPKNFEAVEGEVVEEDSSAHSSDSGQASSEQGKKE